MTAEVTHWYHISYQARRKAFVIARPRTQLPVNVRLLEWRRSRGQTQGWGVGEGFKLIAWFKLHKHFFGLQNALTHRLLSTAVLEPTRMLITPAVLLVWGSPVLFQPFPNIPASLVCFSHLEANEVIINMWSWKGVCVCLSELTYRPQELYITSVTTVCSLQKFSWLFFFMQETKKQLSIPT